LTALPIPGEPVNLSDILKSRLWLYLQNFARHSFQTTKTLNPVIQSFLGYVALNNQNFAELTSNKLTILNSGGYAGFYGFR
jgi:hypothetical protein